MPRSPYPKTFPLSFGFRRHLSGRISLFILLVSFWTTFAGVKGCWGLRAPKYGDMTHDYDLRSGDVLVLNCTLSSHYLSINPPSEGKFYVNSSHLRFHKKAKFFTEYVHVVDALTAQLKIPSATVEDTGNYYCEIHVPTISNANQLVCSSRVSVGYPPKPVRNFHCLSMYLENFTCSWDVEENFVQTTYRLAKVHKFSSAFHEPQLQPCPETTSNSTSCQWRSDTDPPYDPSELTFNFVIFGNNSLGTSRQNFSLDHYEFVIPNRPHYFEVTEATQTNLSVRWSPPGNLRNMLETLPLRYELWVQENSRNSLDKKVFDVGVNTNRFTVTDLIPNMKYNLSLRGRSNLTDRKGMWGPFATVKAVMLPDVPYLIPEIIKEAYELHHFDGYRTATLYWKPVPEKHHNGENFAYRILKHQEVCDALVPPTTASESDVTELSAKFDHLLENTSYCFLVYTVNHVGISSSHKAIRVARQEDVPPVPEEITAISHDPGHYVISWKPPNTKSGSFNVISYMVFWCSSLKPWLSRCEGPIQWINQSLSGHQTNLTLNLSDTNTNFQFAVVANTADASSGMQWATCIVPYTAALAKIEYVFVESNSSTSLKVSWKLHCTAQRAVVKKFEIEYCKVNKNKQCPAGKKQSVDIIDRSAESFVLQGLHPYSEYRVVIRAYNLAGVPSENSDPTFKGTQQGAPSDPPEVVKAAALENGTIGIQWYPPKEPNGVLTHYMLYINGSAPEEVISQGPKLHEWTVSELTQYTYYKVTLTACVKHDCSPPSLPRIVLTDIGVPGVMEPPRIEPLNSTFVKVSWNAPAKPNGPISMYTIQWVPQKQKNSSSEVQTKNVTGSVVSSLVELACDGVEDGGIVYDFAVRAINLKEEEILLGPFSDSEKVRGCFLTQGTAMVIGIAIGGTLALAIAALLIYKLIDWMRDKIHQVKNITIQLPKGLDGPEANPLNNYEQFKDGLPHPDSTNKGVERLSYIIDDGDNKNRHGSGSSQYSNSSTDELLLKNGKCTKFGRKASGESSGCSSMSSNTTRSHISSDSGTESDFHISSSQDVVFVETNGYKPPLPIVMENQDVSKASEAKVTTCFASGAFKPAAKPVSSLQEGVVLKIDQPYSKFGVTCGKSSAIPPWWMNPLAFYSYHLANSEPSVVDLDQTSEKQFPLACTPYSKVGLARSSGDILRISNENPCLGYSKFGIIRNLENKQDYPSLCDPEIAKPAVSVLMLDGNPVVMNYDVVKKTPSSFCPNISNLSPYISFKQFTQKNDRLCGDEVGQETSYAKFGIRNQFPLISAPDYVTLSDIRVLNKDRASPQSVFKLRSSTVESNPSSQTSSAVESVGSGALNEIVGCGSEIVSSLSALNDASAQELSEALTTPSDKEEVVSCISDDEPRFPKYGSGANRESPVDPHETQIPVGDDINADGNPVSQEESVPLSLPNTSSARDSQTSDGIIYPQLLEKGFSKPPLNRQDKDVLGHRGPSSLSEICISDRILSPPHNLHPSSSTSNNPPSAISETVNPTTFLCTPIATSSDSPRDTLHKGAGEIVQISKDTVLADKTSDLRTLSVPIKNGYVAFNSLLPSVAICETGVKQDSVGNNPKGVVGHHHPESSVPQPTIISVPANPSPLNVSEDKSATNGCAIELFADRQDAVPLTLVVVDPGTTDYQVAIPTAHKKGPSEYFVRLLPNVESEICEV